MLKVVVLTRPIASSTLLSLVQSGPGHEDHSSPSDHELPAQPESFFAVRHPILHLTSMFFYPVEDLYAETLNRR